MQFLYSTVYLKRVGLDDDKENGDNEVRRISLRQVQSD